MLRFPTETQTQSPRAPRTKRTQAQGMAIELSDDELLVSIARDRNQESFAELHRRYAHVCFNVALNTTGNRSLAEEAIKENLPSIIGEESIIASDGAKIVKIPIRSLELPHTV